MWKRHFGWVCASAVYNKNIYLSVRENKFVNLIALHTHTHTQFSSFILLSLFCCGKKFNFLLCDVCHLYRYQFYSGLIITFLQPRLRSLIY